MAGGNFNPYSHQNNDLSTSAGQRKFHRSASSSTDDARYVAGNQARAAQAAAKRAASGSQSGGFGGLLGSLFGKDPRDRDRSTFRNPGKQEGIFGYEGFLRPKTGNAFTDASRFFPLGLISGAINAATTKPVDSGASYTMNTQRGVGPGTGTAPRRSPQQRLSGYTPPQVDASYLNDQPPVIDTTPMNPLNFRWDLNIGQTREQPSNNRRTPENPTGVMNISQPDSYFAGVPPSQRPGAVTQTVGDMGPLMDDLPLGIHSLDPGPPVSPVDEETAYQQWLTSPEGERYSDPDLPDDFRRRMYDSWLRLKAGKF